MLRTKALILTAFLMAPAGMLFAQEPPPADNAPAPSSAMDGTEHGKNAMAVPPSGMQMRGTGMRGMMIGGKAPKNMVATSDGGVVIIAGNKIMKYDKDLNLVKEVEFKSPSE